MLVEDLRQMIGASRATTAAVLTIRVRFAAVTMAVAVVALAACGGGDDTTAASTTTSSTTTVAATTSTSTTAATTTSVTSGAVPAAVTTVTAGPAGGSGEIEVDWQAVSGATGYRVARSNTPAGPFAVSADFDVATGKATKAEGVTNVWSPPPGTSPFTTVAGATAPRQFQYVEVVSGGVDHRYFRVVGYNAAGEGPSSAVVCGAPSGRTAC